MRQLLLGLLVAVAACHGGRSEAGRSPNPVVRPSPPPPPPAVDSRGEASASKEAKDAKGSPEVAGGVTPAADLMGTEWTLRSLKGQPAAQGNRGKRLTLRLTDDGLATGFAGCNQFTARFSNTSSNLRLKPAAATHLSCPRGMTLEREYLEALGKVDRWRRTGRELELLSGDEVVAAYDRP